MNNMSVPGQCIEYFTTRQDGVFVIQQGVDLSEVALFKVKITGYEHVKSPTTLSSCICYKDNSTIVKCLEITFWKKLFFRNGFLYLCLFLD